MSFWKELKRRNVYKVGVAYAIVAWLIAQAAAITFPALHLPGWALTLLIVFLIACFPIVLIIAWAFEVTPEGIKRTKEVPLSESITHLTGKKLNYILAGLLVFALGYIVILKFFAGGGPVETELTSTVTEQSTTTTYVEEASKTIAVLPFLDLSPEKDQEYFVDGLSEELLNCLNKIEYLSVTSRTSAFSFKGTKKTVQEIASILGVAHILEGSVRKAGNKLRVTAQLIRAADDRHIWSESYDKELKDASDILSIQEDIANSVADKLNLTLESLKLLGGTENIKAYELYLVAKGKLVILHPGEEEYRLALESLESIDAAIALDNDFALAWALKADALSKIGELDESLKAAQKAIELEPNLIEAYIELAIIRSAKGEYTKAELAFQKAAEATTTPLGAIPEYIQPLIWYGLLERAREAVEAAVRIDPLNEEILSLEIDIYGRLGDLQRAEEAYERAKAIYGDDFMNDMRITNARLCSGNVVSSDDIVDPHPIMVALKEHVGSPKEGLAELRRFYNDYDYQDSSRLVCIWTWAAYFGDTEFAMEVLEKINAVPDIVWYPSMKEVRQLPQFKELVREYGLVEYWEQIGWPDLCQPTDNGDFECD